jgi:hypothetical protein
VAADAGIATDVQISSAMQRSAVIRFNIPILHITLNAFFAFDGMLKNDCQRFSSLLLL